MSHVENVEEPEDLSRPRLRPNPQAFGLPPRVFLYTPDQLATMLSTSEAYVRGKMMFYDGRSPGRQPKDKFLARNIAPTGQTPEWRVAEQELMRWLRYKRYRLYESAWARS
jgi:hypothetical protein